MGKKNVALNSEWTDSLRLTIRRYNGGKRGLFSILALLLIFSIPCVSNAEDEKGKAMERCEWYFYVGFKDGNSKRAEELGHSRGAFDWNGGCGVSRDDGWSKICWENSPSCPTNKPDDRVFFEKYKEIFNNIYNEGWDLGHGDYPRWFDREKDWKSRIERIKNQIVE